MILLTAVLMGLAVGLLRAWIGKRKFQPIELKGLWLVILAFIPQFLAFNLPATRNTFPTAWIPYVLPGSQIFLLLFTWLNRYKPGFWLLGLGALLNFLVIAFNRGFMPLSPENAQKLIPDGVEVILTIGERIGFGKDILLPQTATKLWFLSDIFTLPEWLNYLLAFSIGDIFISTGAFWLLWSLGDPQYITSEV